MKALFLVPEDKFDCDVADLLLDANIDEVLSVKDELLGWIKDFNWPCAQAILNVLAKRFSDFQKLYEYAFKQYENNPKDKNNPIDIGVIRSILYIYYLLDDDHKNEWKHYVTYLLRIKDQPTRDEMLEGIYDCALEILEGIEE